MKIERFPNTLLIGVQKAATTTLDDWLNQHPEIFSYTNIKDFNLFDRFKTKEKIEKILREESKDYKNEKIVLHSVISYIFFPQSLAEIADACPNAKLLLILRNPVDRAISAYNYFKKRFDETRPIDEALFYTPKDYPIEYSVKNNDFTYIEHSLYYRQIKNCFQYFKPEQLLILDYDELVSNPSNLVKKIFSFIGVDENFQPDFSAKNVTSEGAKNKLLHKFLWKQSATKKWIINNIFLFWLPESKRIKLKIKLRELNEKKETAKKNSSEKKENLTEIKQKLKEYFKEDIQQLDKLIGSNYYEKWIASS